MYTVLYTPYKQWCGTLLALCRALHKPVSHKTEDYAENIPEDGGNMLLRNLGTVLTASNLVSGNSSPFVLPSSRVTYLKEP